MGVCCIVFDIDGMLFEFCYEFFFYKLFFLEFHVFLAFYAISNIFITKQISGWGYKKICVWVYFWVVVSPNSR